MRVQADPESAEVAIRAFAEVHNGQGHGPCDAKTARKARLRAEQTAEAR